MTIASSAHAAALWYNGDYDFNDAYVNQSNVPINIAGTYELEKSLVYDDFVVPNGQTWTVTGLFSNDQQGYYVAPTTATWEIRTGMSSGDGGTLVAGGDSSISNTLLTAADGNNYILPEYQVSAAVPTVTLTAGTYWMAIAPDSAGYYSDQDYIETTGGANSIDLPQGTNGDSYINNSLSGPGSLSFAPSSLDFSAGVIGTETSVPEPVTLPAVTAFIVGAVWLSRRRRRQVVQSIARHISIFEPLESRQLLSGNLLSHHAPTHPVKVPAHHVSVDVKAIPSKASVQNASKGHPFNQYVLMKPITTPRKGKTATQTVPVPGAYTPVQLRNAYGVNALGTANQGQGMTIGIVDEFNDTDITSDANAFSAEYNLPKLDGLGGDPTMTVRLDTALASVGTAAGTGVGVETSLDVEWAHAMAPRANILLVEVPASGTVANEFAELLHGVQLAAQLGADVVSLSYGYAEASIGGSNVISQNNTYLASGAASNIAVTVSTGDNSTPLFPATSPNVIGVGGSSLYLASIKGSYSFETAWGGLAGAGAGGGGLSSNFAAPTFQSKNGVNFSNRSIPDVSMDADPVTGVSVYDSLDATSDGGVWTSVGGTSLASPLFAGIIALAQQNRVSAGKALLTSLQINNEIYSVYNSPSYSTYFHDITEGSDKNVNSSGGTLTTGHGASVGYDQATGVGSPIASTFVPLLSVV
jgi:hypothetical protein